MDPITFLIIVVICVFVAAYFIGTQFTKLPEEKGEQPIYEEVFRPGYIGDVFMIPLPSTMGIRFTIYDKFLVINTYRKILLRWGDIKHVEVKSFLLQEALHIHHIKKDVPEKVIVYLENNTRAKEIIEQHLTTTSVNQ